MTSFRIFLMAGCCSVAVVTAGYFWVSGEEKKSWTISGGEKGGNYDEVAQAIAKSLEVANGWEVKVINSSGSLENLELLRDGKVDLCLIQNDLPGNEKTRTLTTLYDEVLHVITRDGNSTLSNFSGKTISVGPVKGGTTSLAKATFSHLGVSMDDNIWKHEGLKKGLENLNAGKTDAVCVVTGVGNQLISNSLRKGGLKLLSLGTQPAIVLSYTYPFVQPATIPAAAYPISPGKGFPKTTLASVGVKVVLACSSELAENAAFILTDSLFENRATLSHSKALLASMSPPTEINDLQFAMHEGARQFYARDAPTFLQNWSEPMALVLSVMVIAWAVGSTLKEFILSKRKDSLDKYFKRVEKLVSELVEGVDLDRLAEITLNLHDIRRETTQKLITEKLDSNESFVIFQRQLHTAQQLVYETRRKIKARETAQLPDST